MLADTLVRRGYQLVEFGKETDLLVLNTCSVTENAEKDCRYAVRKTLRHSPWVWPRNVCRRVCTILI